MGAAHDDDGGLAAPGASTEPEGDGQPQRSRSILATVGLVVLTASAVFGSNLFGLRERVLGPDERPPAVSRVAGGDAGAADEGGTAGAGERTVLRSYPWWQQVATFEGTGATTVSAFTIDDSVLQWRVRWTCESGRLRVGEAGAEEPLTDAECSDPQPGYAVEPGEKRLEVTASGPWTLEISQQVDVPLVEPPLDAMGAPGAQQVSSGTFYGIDQVGDGTVAVHRLADGTHAVRLEDFYVTPNSDLEIVFSRLDRPESTEAYAGAPSSERVAFLDVTAGSMNFPVPPGIDPSAYGSVVIWCERLHSAYAAATLTGGQ